MIYFYHGPDTYSLSAAVKKLKAQYPLVEELEYEEGAEGRLREVLQSQGLFARKKLVILRGWVGEAQDLPFNSPPHEEGKGEVTVLFLEPSSPDKRLKFFKWLLKNAQTREFTAPTGAALEKWIAGFVAERGSGIEPAAVKELIARIGEPGDLWQYVGELEKLMLYQTPSQSPPISAGGGAGGEKNNNSFSPSRREGGDEEGVGGVISADHVRELVSRNFQDDVFAITNAFAEGRVGEAAAVLERLPAEPVQIVGALSSQIRSLLLVKALEDKSPAEMVATLGWKEGRVWINRKLAAKFTQSRLIGMLQDLLAIDRRLKTTEEPPKLLLTLFIQKAKA